MAVRGRYTMEEVLQFLPVRSASESLRKHLSTIFKDDDPAEVARWEIMQIAQRLNEGLGTFVSGGQIGAIARELHAYLLSMQLPAPRSLPKPTEGMTAEACRSALYEVALAHKEVKQPGVFQLDNVVIVSFTLAGSCNAALDNVIVLERSALLDGNILPGTIYMPLGKDSRNEEREINFYPPRHICEADLYRTSWERLHAVALELGLI